MAVALAVALVLLLKYAIDLLAIVLVVVLAGLLLHGLGMRLVDSEVFSPTAMMGIVLLVGIVGYFFLVPDDTTDVLSKRMPRWLVNALEWSEQHGWGGTVWITPPKSETTQPTGADARPGGFESGLPSAVPLPILVVTASSHAIPAGRHVTLMARQATSEVGAMGGRAKFYDGSTVLATVEFQSIAGTRIASLVLRGLTVGRHDIRAEFVDPLGRSGPLSDALPLVVVPR